MGLASNERNDSIIKPEVRFFYGLSHPYILDHCGDPGWVGTDGSGSAQHCA